MGRCSAAANGGDVPVEGGRQDREGQAPRRLRDHEEDVHLLRGLAGRPHQQRAVQARQRPREPPAGHAERDLRRAHGAAGRVHAAAADARPVQRLLQRCSHHCGAGSVRHAGAAARVGDLRRIGSERAADRRPPHHVSPGRRHHRVGAGPAKQHVVHGVAPRRPQSRAAPRGGQPRTPTRCSSSSRTRTRRRPGVYARSASC